MGGLGNDVITGGGGADVFYGGKGDDTAVVATTDFALVDGGAGNDTLSLSGSGLTLDLATLRNKLSGIEVIDLTGSGNNTLNLELRDLVNLSDTSNTLIVMGNAGDKVNAVLGAGFVVGSDQVVGGNTYHTYIQGAAVLLVGVNLLAGDIIVT